MKALGIGLYVFLLQQFTTPLSVDQMTDKQAVIVTTRGELVIEFLPAKAPNHVGYFMKLADENFFEQTSFHRVIKYGIVQGGDPETKDPAARDRFGSGGLGILTRELSDEKHVRGAISAVQRPNDPDSAGSQFFIVVTDQPALDGGYTIFARVVEGIHIAQEISEIPVDEAGLATERVEIVSVTIRDKPPPEPTPFESTPVATMSRMQVKLETNLGDITVRFFPELAPNHVRNFLRLSQVGAYTGTSFHRVVPGFVIQTGFLETRREPVTERLMKWVGSLQPEFNDRTHQPGILSMAHGEDPASASTSFFIVTGDASGLDGSYTVFGEVVAGMEVVRAIEALETDGETPRERVEILDVVLEEVNE